MQAGTNAAAARIAYHGRMRSRGRALGCISAMVLAACGGSTSISNPPRADGGSVPPPTTPSCDPAAGGGSATVAEPTMMMALADRFEEAWLGSPAVADLDGDGKNEIVVARDDKLVVWK